MIKIKLDKEGFLTQWDIERKVVISGLDGIEGVKVHFASPDDDHGAYVVDPVEQDGAVYADVPNILLTESGRVDVFVYTTYTRVRAALMVFPREKPDDYVYTETEVLKYEDFVERLDGLETQKEDKANRVTTVDDNSDDEHYPTAKAVYKAIPKSLKNPYSLTFTGAVTGSYDGSKPLTFKIPVGGSGTDISLSVTGASVGDIIKVKAVDENGKPTAWEAAGLPSGDNWELLNEFSISENAMTVMINQDSSGNAFTLKKMRIIMYLPQITNTSGETVPTGYANYLINGVCPSSYLYPSSDWSNGEFWWDIEVMDNVLYVKCRKSNGGGGLRPTLTTAFHYSNSVQSKYEGGITSFLWTIFSPNENKPSAMAGATFKVWGVRI